jgi:capsular polysaccharide transport system ATP-binding protein
MIRIEGLSKRFTTRHGSHWVLKDIDLVFPDNLSVGLIGANGAGKSTLLRLIAGNDEPTRGRIHRDCRVSWPMGLSGGFQGSLTGRQNAKFICRVHGGEKDIPEKLAFIEEFSELGDSIDEPVRTYSTGMRARLGFALSLAFKFDVYLSDEVTSVGDVRFRQKAQKAFRDLAGQTSLIMVSHAEPMLKEFCQAGVWLRDGEAIWFDNIDDALKNYRESQRK